MMTSILLSSSRLHGVPDLKILAEKSMSRKDHMDNNDPKKQNQPLNDFGVTLHSLKQEANRIKTFAKGWPVTFIKPDDLAAVGLFYLGEGDRVQCAFCLGIISSWEEGDKPMVEHVKHYPMCPFLLNQNVGNVPINGVNGRQKWQVSHAYPERWPSNGQSTSNYNRRTIEISRAKYPVMACFDTRLRTYQNLTNNVLVTITPGILAEAGLYYSGTEDVVTCFCCGGTLGNWKADDNPWREHAKHFPTCSYLKSIKGSAFIEQARMKFLSEDGATCGVQEHQSPDLLLPNGCEENSRTGNSTKPYESICNKMEAIEVTENPAEEDNNQESGFLCKICMELKTRVAFLPCGHSLACPDCAKEVSVCPLCRAPIKSIVRLYFG